MSLNLLAAVGIAVWGIVFVLLLAGMAIAADIERRWTAEWALGWEKRNMCSVDVLIDRLASQTRQWRTARKMLNLYVWLGLSVLAILGFFQYRRWIMDPVAFRSAMLFGLALVGLFLLPVRVVCEVGLGLVDAMYRQVRSATDDKLVIRSAGVIAYLPVPDGDKKAAKKKKAEEPKPPAKPAPAARQVSPQAAAKQAPGPASKK
jgi:hypothetical protein